MSSLKGKIRILALFSLSAIFLIASSSVYVKAGDDENPYGGDKKGIAEGMEIFQDKCSECHGDGTGGSGPDLTDDRWIYGGSDPEVYESVYKGRPGGMPSMQFELGSDKVWKVIAYVRTLAKH